jgi:hypothetical protein
MFEQILNNLMTVGHQIMGVGAKLEGFLIPAVILGAIALLVFARYSFRLFRIVLPIAGIVLGSTAGASLVAPLLAKYVPVVGEFINPFYLAGIVIALVLAVFCFKFYNFTVLLIGASLGFIVVARLVKDVLLSLAVTKQIIATVSPAVVSVVGIAIAVVCLIVTAIIVRKFFKPLYILLTSTGASVLALGVAAMFIFATTDFTVIATLAAAGVGVIVGLVLTGIQAKESEF